MRVVTVLGGESLATQRTFERFLHVRRVHVGLQVVFQVGRVRKCFGTKHTSVRLGHRMAFHVHGVATLVNKGFVASGTLIRVAGAGAGI